MKRIAARYLLSTTIVLPFAGCSGKPTTPEEHERLEAGMAYENEQQQRQMYEAQGYGTFEEEKAEGAIPQDAVY